MRMASVIIERVLPVLIFDNLACDDTAHRESRPAIPKNRPVFEKLVFPDEKRACFALLIGHILQLG